MGRQLRTTIPQVSEHLRPKWTYLDKFRQIDKEFKEEQKLDYDHRHSAKELPPIPEDTDVWITSGASTVPGCVISAGATPRSYQVSNPQGTFQRNLHHLNESPTKEVQPNHSSVTDHPIPSPNRIMTRPCTGTAIRPPERL